MIVMVHHVMADRVICVTMITINSTVLNGAGGRSGVYGLFNGSLCTIRIKTDEERLLKKIFGS